MRFVFCVGSEGGGLKFEVLLKEGGGGGGGRFPRLTVGKSILGGGGGGGKLDNPGGGGGGGRLDPPPPPLGFEKFCYRSFLALLKLSGFPLISSLGGGGESTEEVPPLCLAKNA